MLYNIVDRIYIGHIPEIGTAALTGVGITFPIITLISAFSSLDGHGRRAPGLHRHGRPPQGAGRGDHGQLLYRPAGALRGAHGGVLDFPGAHSVGLRGQREHHWLRHGLHGHLRVRHGVCPDLPGHEHVHHLPGLCQNQHADGDYRRGAEHCSWTRCSSLSSTWACGARPLPRCSARRFRRCGCCCSSAASAPL